jgi:hypothetical protein
MPSRSEMDRPATVVAALLGIVLIVVTIPYFVGDDGGSTTYDIAWTATEHGSSQANTGAAGSTTTLEVPFTDAIAANAQVTRESCTDGGNAVTGTATISWTLFKGDEELDAGTFTCAGADEAEVALGDQPDLGQAKAGSAPAATEEAYAAGDNETAEYRLEFSWTRGGGASPLPLPVTAPFAATLKLTVEQWTATANEAQEVPR